MDVRVSQSQHGKWEAEQDRSERRHTTKGGQSIILPCGPEQGSMLIWRQVHSMPYAWVWRQVHEQQYCLWALTPTHSATVAHLSVVLQDVSTGHVAKCSVPEEHDAQVQYRQRAKRVGAYLRVRKHTDSQVHAKTPACELEARCDSLADRHIRSRLAKRQRENDARQSPRTRMLLTHAAHACRTRIQHESNTHAV